jgi:hypothetical protein
MRKQGFKLSIVGHNGVSYALPRPNTGTTETLREAMF